MLSSLPASGKTRGRNGRLDDPGKTAGKKKLLRPPRKSTAVNLAKAISDLHSLTTGLWFFACVHENFMPCYFSSSRVEFFDLLRSRRFGSLSALRIAQELSNTNKLLSSLCVLAESLKQTTEKLIKCLLLLESQTTSFNFESQIPT